MAPTHPASLFAPLGTALTALAAGYAVTTAWATANPRRPRAGPVPVATSVSVLKPLCGGEPGLEENLRSFCEQIHPQFELLCGVREERDPAVAVVRRLQAEYPAGRVRLVVDPRVHGVNLKISTLINLLDHAAHPLLVLADSDIRVPVGYLDRVTAPLADPQVGIVTCLYRGFGRTGAWSRFGAGFISDWFAPSVRLAHRFGGSRFAFGATIALRRATLDAIGGFAPLRDVLADDFWLGELTRQRGLSTVLSEVVVTTDVVESDFSALWNHEVRWMRTIRSLAPVGFTGLFVTCTFPLVLAGLCLARTPLAWGLAAAGAVARLAAPVLAERGIERRRALRRAWFAPARDTLLLLEWAAAHARTSVRWRGQRFRVWPKPRTPLT